MASALERVVAATVRLSTDDAKSGTGFLVQHGAQRVIVTAAHVVGEQREVRVSAADYQGRSEVLAANSETDVAVLTDDPRMEQEGLRLVEHSPALEVGEDIVVCGYPSGWDGARPVIGRGVLASIEGKNAWVNADSTWGHSGGSVSLGVRGERGVVGLVSGRAGSVHGTLRRTAAVVQKQAAIADRWLPVFEGHYAAAKAEGMKPWWNPVRVPRLVSSLWESVSWTASYAIATARDAFELQALLAEMIDSHFRTGYTRMVTVDEIRKLLA